MWLSVSHSDGKKPARGARSSFGGSSPHAPSRRRLDQALLRAMARKYASSDMRLLGGHLGRSPAMAPVQLGGPGERGTLRQGVAIGSYRIRQRRREGVGELGRQDRRRQQGRRGQIGDRERVAGEVARRRELTLEPVERRLDLAATL